MRAASIAAALPQQKIQFPTPESDQTIDYASIAFEGRAPQVTARLRMRHAP
jgi:hypothetical protein